MAEKAYLYLLIVSTLLCQGFLTRFAVDDDTWKLSDFRVRNKRVINHEPGGDTLARFRDINYIVNIRENTRMHCVGAILSHLTVISAARCFLSPLSNYRVESNSGYSHRSKNHNVISQVVHFGNPPHESYNGIALIKVDPAFTLGRNTGIISLHVEPVFQGIPALISGWGCYHPTSQPMTGLQKLRSITLPIMNHRECVASYAGHFVITNKHICTYDEQKLCGLTDIGTPLVIGNMLVGIHVFKGQYVDRRNPDVFLDVQRLEYSNWIRENTLHQ